MKTKTHTPGPWEHDETYGLIISKKGHEIAACHADRERKKGESMANARLIASAPELLQAALEFQCAVYEAFGCVIPGRLVGTSTKLTEVINKAQGEL